MSDLILQEYIYSFKYGDSGVEFELNSSSHKGKKNNKYSSADAKVCTAHCTLHCRADTARFIVRLLLLGFDCLAKEVSIWHDNHLQDQCQTCSLHAGHGMSCNVQQCIYFLPGPGAHSMTQLVFETFTASNTINSQQSASFESCVRYR